MNNYRSKKENCQHPYTFIQAHHFHAAGEYCADCGTWIRWLSKKEYANYLQSGGNV